MPANGPDIMARYQRLKAERHNFDWRWEEMAPFLAPSRVGITGEQALGDKQTRGVYDSTALGAVELFAMFMAGRVINPSDRWLLYRMRDPEADKVDSIREWLEEARDRTLRRFDTSMFYAEAPEALLDWSGFGTGFLLLEERPQPENVTLEGFRGFFVSAERTGRFVIAEGADGLVDTAMREFRLTARIAKERWGEERLPEPIRQVLANGKPDQFFTFVHVIQPRPLSERGAGALGMPWASVWIESQSKEVIHEGGYRVFPAAIPRYTKTPGEVYGRGRGELAFPDIWTLNSAKKMGFEDWALKIKPPPLVSHNAVIGRIRLVPGAPTTVNTHGRPMRDVIAPYETGSRPEISMLREEELRRSIRELFFWETIRQLLQVEKSEMTAFEFGQKLNLLFRIVATAYGRLRFEFLHRVGEVAFETQFFAGDFPPPPPELFQTDGEILVEFENPLARAQRAGDAEALALSFQDLAPMLQAMPETFDWLDPDEVAPGVLALRGVPAKWTRSARQVAGLRQERRAQQQAEQDLAATTQVAQAAGQAAPMVREVRESGQPAGAARP